jgi:hypothetical protein
VSAVCGQRPAVTRRRTGSGRQARRRVPVRSADADEQQNTAAVALRGRPRVERDSEQHSQLPYVVPSMCAPLSAIAVTRRRAGSGCQARWRVLVRHVLEQRGTAALALRGRPRVANAIGQNPQLQPVVPTVRESNALPIAQPSPRRHARMTIPLTAPSVILSRRAIESPLGGSCSTMGDLREERAPAAPEGRGHPRPFLSLADAQLAAAERGGVCLSDTYSNCKTPLWWRCAAGHEWSTAVDNVRNHGTWCPQCAVRGPPPLSIADAQSAAAKLGGVCLSDTYANSKTPLLWRCAAGHEWSAPFRNVRTDGTWCPQCARRGRPPLTLADAQAVAVKRGGVCLSDTYSNRKTPLRWRCAAGHEWRAPLVKIRNCRRWCPLCAKAANRRQRNHRRAAKHA